MGSALHRRSSGQTLRLVTVGLCVVLGGQAQEGPAGHSMCLLCSPGIESHSGPAGASWAAPYTRPELCVLSSPGGPFCPDPTSQG